MTGRLIWITDEECWRVWRGQEGLRRLILERFDAAPAAPTKAIAACFADHFPGALDNQDLADFAADVLRVLGPPNPSE